MIQRESFGCFWYDHIVFKKLFSVTHYMALICTLSLKSLSGHSSVCYKTSLNTGGVGWAGAAPPTSKLGKFLSWPLALSTYVDL